VLVGVALCLCCCSPNKSPKQNDPKTEKRGHVTLVVDLIELLLSGY
jgi:hypothetical protein